MDNKETLKQNNSRIDINNTDLASILITINNLPKYEKVILQEKNVTPNTEIQEIVPDVGYTGLSKVNVAGDSDLLPENIKKGVNIFGVDGEASVADFEINDCTYLFYNGARVNAIDGLLPLCKNTVSTRDMFYQCNALTSLDLSSFDTSSVTDMYRMFSNCSSLTSLDLSNFDTSNVTNMYGMFNYCQSLTSLDLSNFDTSSVTNMGSVFVYCQSLTSLDLSSFDTSSVTDMGFMFQNCKKLTSLDLSNFDTSSVTNMGYMFYQCNALTSLDLSSFDTSSVTNMGYMFSSCNVLKSLDIRNFTFDKVTSYSSMFGKVPTDCLIIVKGDTEKEWITSKFTTLTNVKTVAEL